MAKITKAKQKEFVKSKLSSDSTWAKKALLKIFEFQTVEEQVNETTHDHNGVGFTGFDGEILSSFAKQLQDKASYGINDDPSAFDIEEEDFDTYAEFEKAVEDFKERVCTKILKQLR